MTAQQRKCRCGKMFAFVGFGRPLCPTCTLRWKARRAREFDFPKCRCGATLGLLRQQESKKLCPRCEGLEHQAHRQVVLNRIADWMIDEGRY